MKNKKILIILAVVFTIAIPASVFGATSNPNGKGLKGFVKIDPSKLNDKQKADVQEYSKKMADLKKEFINKMIANGSITKEEGTAAINRIDNAAKNGHLYGGMFGRKHDAQSKGGKFDTSKLTDKQKADLKESLLKIAELQKELVNKMVANGAIPKEKGDRIIQRIDNRAKGGFENGYFKQKRMRGDEAKGTSQGFENGSASM